MDLVPHGDGFSEEAEQLVRGKLPFSYSSPSSSSSSHYKTQMLPLTNNGPWDAQIYDHHHRSQRAYVYDAAAASDAKLELMDSSPRNEDDDVRRGDSDGLGGSTTSIIIEREHMFDKVVTPSDVGKLNRLVIPKQHAEKYFPLDSSTNEKGLLLNFEDRNGKPWRFRYSYWNSSQSYVMTKGWSRFVKEKKLDAGDIVSFQRGLGDLGKDRLFIDWRRRPDGPEPQLHPNPSLPPPHHFSFHRSVPWNPMLMRPPGISMPSDHHLHLSQLNANNVNLHHPYRNSYGSGGGGGSYGYCNVVNPCAGSVVYLRSPATATQQQQQQLQQQQQQQLRSGFVEPMVFESVPVVHGKAAAKRLRLFGVNMECPISEADECDILSSTSIAHAAHVASQPATSSIQSPLQLRLYNGTPLPLPTATADFLNKGKTSLSLDFNI